MTKPHILIIEDDVDMGLALAEILQEDAGAVTEIVADGQTALDILASTIPHVVLLDLHLPKISGLEILQQIRQDHRLDNTKVILVTADVFRMKEIAPQADFAISKPFRPDKLIDLIVSLT